MISIILYSISVFVILILYYFYKPQQEPESINQQQQQQQHDSLDQQQTSFNQSDLLSLSSSISLSTNLQTNENQNLDENSNDLSSSFENNLKTRKFTCYTYSNYKDGGHSSINNKKPCSNNDAIIVEFLKKYCNKNVLFKYLGLSNSFDKNENFGLNHQINDSFKTFDDLILELNNIGLVQFNIIIGIDFTASNEWKGRKTFNSQSLHKTLGNKIYNPYQKVLSIFENVFKNMSIKIHAYGFGDHLTKDETVFSFYDYELNNDNDYFKSFDEVLQRYNTIVKKVCLSSPTSFAPIINKSIEFVKTTSEYHVLFIIADGKVNDENENETIKAIENASNYALSIVMIGVGDGPWDTMVKFDDKLVNRKFDNFQFVDFHRLMRNTKASDLRFTLNALMEIPEQYKYAKTFGYI